MPPKRQASTATRGKTSTKPTATKPAAKPAPKASAPASAPASRKRKAATLDDEAEKVPAKPVQRKRQKDVQAFVPNQPPTQRLDVYVFGTNCYGELGLGDATKKSELPGPVLNPKLAADTVGVVHLTIGGVHSAALTHDNKILTWGVNDEGTLGRDTTQDPTDVNTKDADQSDSDSDDDEISLNLKEATPMPVDPSHFPKGTIFTQLAATDSSTFALTSEGLVYGWGTFRGSSGPIGFSPTVDFQRTPALIPDLHEVTKLVAGAQHVLALTSKGIVYSWGCDEQRQLGRRRPTRIQDTNPLLPGECALPPNIVDIGRGSYNSFALRKTGAAYAWGSNNFGQTGISANAGDSDAIVLFPTKVTSLRDHRPITCLTGGKDHSIAIANGRCLIWGRIDNKALGLAKEDMPAEKIVRDEYDRPRILTAPTPVKDIEGEVTFVTAGPDHTFAITDKGTAYSWGFNTQCQAGQGRIDEVEKPTLLENKHVKDKKLVCAAAGGQFSLVAGEHMQSNGVHA
ncbi:Regulator of chromosome condensation [Aspergillus nanangensis]|uniref:Regulator of chromosome condensation n=1 Tax=Aspergillus nanangensis TaxID=2582783 RepID=A0AAD4CM38_ASPNN|nr:Regulator of chromosome condensation [Aspergillus nanangensis]